MTDYKNIDIDDVAREFRKMPTHNNDTFELSDLEQFFKNVGFHYTPDTLQGYKEFWKGCFEGKVQLSVMGPALANLHDTREVLRACVVPCDVNKDGHISADEFKVILDMIQIHDPHFERVDFTTFAAEADTNDDGKISIDEAVEWFSKKFKKTKC